MSAMGHKQTFTFPSGPFRFFLMAASALFPTLATAASISSVVLLRRLRIRRAKSLVVMTTRLRGGFGRDEVATAALRWINNEPPNYFSFPTRLLEEEIVFCVRFRGANATQS